MQSLRLPNPAEIGTRDYKLTAPSGPRRNLLLVVHEAQEDPADGHEVDQVAKPKHENPGDLLVQTGRNAVDQPRRRVLEAVERRRRQGYRHPNHPWRHPAKV